MASVNASSNSLAAQREVAELYARLWGDVGDYRTPAVRAQFLSNVGLPAEWFAGKLCLDVGCGSGFAVWCMESLGGLCVGCDLNDRSLLNVRRRLAHANGSPLLTSGSAYQLPFGSETFDFVHCNGVLHHTLHPRRGFDELVRVTRPGGYIFVSLYGKGGLYGAAVGLARLAAPVVPYRFADAILDAVFGGRRLPNSFMPAKVSVLDNMYVPIRHAYREREIRNWFAEEGISGEAVQRTKNTIYDHTTRLNRIVHGEGYLQFLARKPAQSNRHARAAS